MACKAQCEVLSLIFKWSKGEIMNWFWLQSSHPRCRLAGCASSISITSIFKQPLSKIMLSFFLPKLLSDYCMLQNLTGSIDVTFLLPSDQVFGIHGCWSKWIVSLAYPHQILHQSLASSQGSYLPALTGLSKVVDCSDLTKKIKIKSY